MVATVSWVELCWLVATLVQGGLVAMTTWMAASDLAHVRSAKMERRLHLIAWKGLVTEIIWVVVQAFQLYLVILLMTLPHMRVTSFLNWQIAFTAFVMLRLFGGILVVTLRKRIVA